MEMPVGERPCCRFRSLQFEDWDGARGGVGGDPFDRACFQMALAWRPEPLVVEGRQPASHTCWKELMENWDRDSWLFDKDNIL